MLRLLCSTTSVRRFASSSSTKITDALMKRREAAVPKALSAIHPVFINRADNTQLFDVDGRRFLDFAGGIAVMNVGHVKKKRESDFCRFLINNNDEFVFILFSFFFQI